MGVLRTRNAKAAPDEPAFVERTRFLTTKSRVRRTLILSFGRVQSLTIRAILSFGRFQPLTIRAILSFGRVQSLTTRNDISFGGFQRLADVMQCAPAPSNPTVRVLNLPPKDMIDRIRTPQGRFEPAERNFETPRNDFIAAQADFRTR